MAFDGSGTFNRTDGTRSGTTVWSQAETALVKVVSPDHDTHDQGLADGLTNCICRDGQSTVSANIPFNSKRITGLGAATATADAAQASQVQNGAFTWLGTTSGTNTITASVSPSIAAYAAGQRFIGIAGGSNSAATTLNLNSLGAKNILDLRATALVGGEIKSANPVDLVYDGTQFVLLNSHGGWQTYTPTYGATASMTWAGAADYAEYRRRGLTIQLKLGSTAGAVGGTPDNGLTFTLPSAPHSDNSPLAFGGFVLEDGTRKAACVEWVSGTTVTVYKYDSSNYTGSVDTAIRAFAMYREA